MGGDKRRGGGYVGGFLQLFDWNSKSRKKLFATKPDFRVMDQSKHKKRTEPSLPMTLFYQEHEADEPVTGGYSCASSVINEEEEEKEEHGYGIKAPSVIARLMGLDSLPTRATPTSNSEQETPLSLEYKPEKVDNLVQKAIHKNQQQAVEKFQTETLPRKSAKSIPITRHKLLSPVKSPGFVPSCKDAAQIMEAATKIIEPALPANNSTTVTTKKVVKLLPSSVPLKTKDLKEKAVAAAVSIGRGRRSMNGSCSDWDKEKSVSLALQAKVNVQRREGILRQISNNIPSQPHNTTQKKKKKNSSGVVLKQNNQKQNSTISQGRRRSLLPLDEVYLRKLNQFGHDDDKQSVSSSSSSIIKTVSRKKRLIGADKRNDIVSFTFTAPMTRSGTLTPRLQTDDLSALLEQKLRELANVVQSSSAFPLPVSEFQDQEKTILDSWELEYVKEILYGVELMIEDYAIGRSKKIINPHLFHQIGSPMRGDNKDKKLLFDCVGESMELRCMSAGGWKAALSFGRRRKTIADEVYGDISGWRIGRGGGGEDIMVDDLVDRDMSSPYGKWLDFEIEKFQIGVEIQGSILNTIINEVIADMIASNSKLQKKST